MKILYDHQVFSWQKFGGISRYFYELMMHSQGLFDYELSGIFSDNEYMGTLKTYKNFLIPYQFKGKQRIVNTLNRTQSINLIKKAKYDIIHPTYYDPYILKLKKTNRIPLIIDVHDMIYEKFPKNFRNPQKVINNKRKYFIRADKIVATSEKTKEDLLSIYSDIPENKIVVIYRGNTFPVNNIEQEKERYLLFTGSRHGYKNFNNFIIAIAPLMNKYNLKLICTGQKFSNKEMRLFENYKIENMVFCKMVTDCELIELYRKASAFIFPSLYEGFGLPILEAFSSGCPIILSNSSCFPEIAGDAAEYFDPCSLEDMRVVIEKVITSSSLREQLISKGKERVKQFSWERCANETAQVYSSLLGNVQLAR
ncbi:glycosyltransferase family 4 protein [Treponema primitia]|nr:glycosyltransferase family 1 protein [Treponema primitia]